MLYQELLRDLTESYLKSLFSEVSGSLNSDFDSVAPFGELGIDSFYVLKIIRRLEADFGTLPKSLLFENFNINDLANYFISKHEQILSAKFAEKLNGANSSNHNNDRQLRPVEVLKEEKPLAASPATIARVAAPIRILEKDAYRHPEFQELVQTLFDRYKLEGCVSRGTRKIAPNLFIGSARRGYFNYARSKNIILVYSYTGPRDYLPALMEEIYRYCEVNNFQLNIFADEEIPSISGTSFSATPFGVLQRITNLKGFMLEGGAMRRLRYQVSKFQKSGICKTEEYQCGSNQEIDKNIASIIDQWCGARTMVNPLVYDVKKEILVGALGPDHRLFLTYLNDALQNVILITAMSGEEKGYLMDLEFYPPDMPMGGLEFAIVQIIDLLAAEGCDVLSLGGTYGCKLSSSANADPEIDKILDDLRGQNIFNDEGNLQFKNKFRPENKTIFLCRPVGSGNPDNVVDIIMMIADPEKMQTSDEENHSFSKAQSNVVTFVEEPAPRKLSAKFSSVSSEQGAIEGNERSRILSDFGFNPLNIPHEHVEFDLKTDSWAQLAMPAIEIQMKHLHTQLQQPANVDESLRAVFPFAYFVLTGSGQEAEHIFFKAWPKKGVVLQNLLFPSTIFHQIDNGFTLREMPHPAIFELNSHEQYKGNMAWDALQAQVAQDASAIACVCIEAGNNAAGGYAVSMQHLREVKALLAKHSIPLVIDGTRVVENAQFLAEREKEFAGKSVWTVVREILSCADAVIGSLTKDFCVNKGGIVATNDAKLFHRLQQLVHEEGTGIDLIDKKMIALSLQNRKQIEAKVLRRIEGVRLIWRALNEHNVPIVQPAGGHCILIDVKQIPEFKDFKCPAASFVAWMYLNTGIRAGAHSVGMQKHTPINDLVRLAIPVGLTRDQIDCVIDRLIHALDERVNIPEIVMESNTPQPLGAVHANYKLLKYHKVTENIVTRTDSTIAAAGEYIPTTPPAVSGSSSTSSKPAAASSRETVAENATQEPESAQIAVTKKSRRIQDVAIVGMAGRYPKAKNVRELWENLVQGRDCIEDIPADRYERRLQHGSTSKYRGGFIDDVDKFDSLFFNISPLEAEMLDPQERLFLEVAWEAIEDAGYYPEILGLEDGSRNIGVFVGAVWAMYQMLGVEEKHAGNKIVPNSFLWSIANRVSYWMNLSGPSLTVDTACSSSLTVIYLACEAIYAGECSAAIVGGVNLDLHQAKLDINMSGGALSSDGVCRSFGKDANGYVGGEGIGALFLKPLDQAVQDGDNIYGVIKSAVVNHGGRTSGYTVPNPKAQTNLVLSALEKANIGARSIGYIEAHGTGTELGDPIEITGLNNAFNADNVENQTCAIGSIKSNIGHLEAAAGVVGVSKVLLQMKHRQLVPSLHSSELNEFIDFKSSPFHVIQRLEEWKPKEMDGVRLPLRAGVSSFGAGGSNAHIILENYEPVKATEEPAQQSELVFPLSARSEDQLRETAIRLAKFLQESHENLADIAHTLQVGRKSFEHRLAIIVKTKEELLEKLMYFITGKKAEDIATGHIKSAQGITRLLNRKEKEEFVRLLSQRRDPRKLAELWVEGLLADWHGLQTDGMAKRVSLPTYPFADKRHWACKKSPIRQSLQPAAGIHPMVDSNESTFERQLFKKTFHDRDFFIYDHLVGDIPTLPGVAYLELARKAGELAAGRRVQKIRNIVWVSPIAVQNSAPKEVFIELKPSEATVRFEVFSKDEKGNKVLHSQGALLYTTKQEAAAGPEYIDLESIRARCAKVIDGKDVYPLFKSFGLGLGSSFQVLQEIYKNENEILGIMKLPEFRQGDLQSMVLLPSLVDGSLQAGMGAQLGGKAEEMFVPFSICEVEILHPLQANCFSYITKAKEDKKGKNENARVLKNNVLIVDETGKVLVKIHESTGVPLREVHKKPVQAAEEDGFAKLYYLYDWEKASLAAEKAERSSPHSIVLFDTEEKLRDLYQERLRAVGTNSDQVILIRPGENFQDLGKQSYKINPQNKEDFTRLFEALLEKGCSVENICFAWPLHDAGFLDAKALKEAMESGVYAFLFVCQSLIKLRLESKAQLLYLYSAKRGETQPHNEAVGGFIKALRLEHPKLLCKTLEVRQESASYEQILDAVSDEFQAHTQDATAVRYEERERYIRKLKAFDRAEVEAPSPSRGVGLKEKGVYLITGGAGGLGLLFAEFLAKEYKAKLVLTGRSRLAGEREAKLEELRKAGAEVLYLSADVSNCEDVSNVFNEAKSRFGEINGIIHSAGVLRDSNVRNKTLEEMTAVFAPKVYGTLYLDEITKKENLDFFVMFSSLSAVAGNVGQCDYCFANHFMDSFAAERELRRAKGERAGKTLSVNWSIWADGGMKLDQQAEHYFKRTVGIKPLSASTGLEVFMKGLVSERSQFAVLEGVQEKVELMWGLKKRDAAVAPSADPVPSAFSNQSVTAPVAKPAAGNGVIATNGHASNVSSPARDGAEQVTGAYIQQIITRNLSEALQMEAASISNDAPFADYGVNSVIGVNLVRMISETLRIELDPIKLFEYTTVNELTQYICTTWPQFAGQVAQVQDISRTHSNSTNGTPAELEAGSEHRFIRKATPAEADSTVNLLEQSNLGNITFDPIAIIGMSGRFAESESLDELWQNLREGKDLVRKVSRWSTADCVISESAGNGYCSHGSFVDSIDRFDPAFFGISPLEAIWMDPQQRLFLEESWRALEDAGYAGKNAHEKQCGVYVGCANSSYERLFVENPPPQVFWGNAVSVIPARIAYYLNLQGPAIAVDTASSSSLVAIHLACQGLWSGEMEMALAGGVFLQPTPGFYHVTNGAGLLSPDGKCYTFDARANGFVPGEGVGVLVLKRLRDALREGDFVHGVIAGSGINQNGSSNGLIAPNARAQERLERSVYDRFKINPETIQVVEANGTGTILGDSIEYQAVSRAFRQCTEKRQFCAIGSIATNMGHAATAAGVAGVLKLLLALKHREIPPSLHFQTSNPAIDFESGPFYVNTELKEWKVDDNQPRRAAVSSFGIGGTNAHLVIEEAPSIERAIVESPGYLVVLSARTAEQLKQQARNLFVHVKRTPNLSMSDLSFTLFVGRMHLNHRLSCLARNQEELIQLLEQWLETGAASKVSATEIQKGKSREHVSLKNFGNHCIQECRNSANPASYLEHLATIADLYVQGYSLDFQALFSRDSKRMPLPTYPFANERYWVDTSSAVASDQRQQRDANAGSSAGGDANRALNLVIPGENPLQRVGL